MRQEVCFVDGSSYGQAGRKWPRSVGIVAVSAVAYATWFFPGAWLRNSIRHLAGYPSYSGPWILVEHALLYMTLPAAVCLLTWCLLASRKLLEPPAPCFRLHRLSATMAWGFGSGLAVFAFNMLLVGLGSVVGILPQGTAIGWHSISGWEVAGNIFSNFYEEVIYCGFLFTCARTATGSTATAVVATSLLFGLVYTQYTLGIRVILATGAVAASLAYIRTKSLWAAWLNHQVVDMTMGIAFGK